MSRRAKATLAASLLFAATVIAVVHLDQKRERQVSARAGNDAERLAEGPSRQAPLTGARVRVCVERVHRR